MAVAKGNVPPPAVALLCPIHGGVSCRQTMHHRTPEISIEHRPIQQKRAVEQSAEVRPEPRRQQRGIRHGNRIGRAGDPALFAG